MATELRVTGKITKLSPETGGTSQSGKAWRKREFLVQHKEGEYPRSILLTVFGDKVNLLNNVNEGNQITCHLDINTKEYNGKTYNDVSCWKIEF